MRSVPTDVDLVLAAQAGDSVSLGLLLDRHRSGMLAVALAIIGSRSDAHDVVQDAMLVALQRLSELRDPAASGAWLRTIVRNVCRMRLRSSRAPVADESVILDLPSRLPSPEEMLDRHALSDWVWHAVLELSEPLQLVILLRYFTDVSSYDEIAAICGVPIGTVRSRLHQARSILTTSLLASATVSHTDTRALAAQRRHEADTLFQGAKCGEVATALRDLWSPDVTLVWTNGVQQRGWEYLVWAWDHDLNAGVRQDLAQVTAGERFMILECDLVSPPWDPQHCPPSVVWLLSLRENIVEHARLFHPRNTGTVPRAR